MFATDVAARGLDVKNVGEARGSHGSWWGWGGSCVGTVWSLIWSLGWIWWGAGSGVKAYNKLR